jgi:HEAT repeat protein
VEKLHILAENLRSPDEEKRRRAVVALGEYPLAQGKESLFQAMGDMSWRVRKEAVDILVAAATGADAATLEEELVGMLRSQENAGLRNSAVESLERLGRQAVQLLCRHVDDDDHDVRKFIIDIMGSIGDHAFVAYLIRALDDPDANVRVAAAENLGKIRDAQALPALLQALARDDIMLRFTILEAIGKIGRPVPVSAIAPLAQENILKKAIYDCLGAIGDVDGVPLLVEGLKDRARNAREAAVMGLVALRERLSAEIAGRLVDERLWALKGSPFVEKLLPSFETSDRSLKEALVKIFGIIGDERATSHLLHGCRDDSLRRYCLQAFKLMGEGGASSLIEAFPAADDDERCFIVYLCGELRYKGCISLLCEGMLDANPQLRKASVTAAGKTGLIVCINEINHLLDDSEAIVREGALEALYRLAEADRTAIAKITGKLASSEVPEKRRDAAILCTALADTEKLSLLIKDEDASVRTAAVSSLAGLKSAANVGHLVMALVDEDPDVRIAAAGALGVIGGENVVTPLLLALKDDDPRVTCAALKSLGKLRSDAALPAIVELIEHAEGLVMISTLETVAQIGGERATTLIEKALENPDEAVVKAAIDILCLDGDGWIHEHREKLLSHPHWDVRSSFVKAMAAQLGNKSLPYLRAALETESDDLVKGQIVEQMERFL